MTRKRLSRPWWPWVVGILTPAILIPATASAWRNLGEALAAPAKLKETVQKVERIEEYIAEDRKTQEMLEKAPPGWRWDQRVKDFVKDPDDPRLKKR